MFIIPLFKFTLVTGNLILDLFVFNSVGNRTCALSANAVLSWTELRGLCGARLEAIAEVLLAVMGVVETTLALVTYVLKNSPIKSR